MQTPEEKKAALRAPLLEEKAGIEKKIAALEAQIKGSSSPMAKRSTTSGSDVGSPEPMDMAAEARLDLEDEKEKLLDVNTRLNKYAGRRRRKTRRRRGGSMGSFPDKLTVAMVTEWLEQVKQNNNQDQVLNRLVRSMSHEPDVFKRAGVKDMIIRAVRDRSEGGDVKDDVIITLNGLRFLLQRNERGPAARPAELPVAAGPGQHDGPGLHPAAPRHGGRRRTRRH
jgi:hypothetical protein